MTGTTLVAATRAGGPRAATPASTRASGPGASAGVGSGATLPADPGVPDGRAPTDRAASTPASTPVSTLTSPAGASPAGTNLAALSSLHHKGGGDHELNTVELVDLAGAGIVVNGHDIGLREAAAHLPEHALADHVVGQAGKGLAAHDIGHPVLNELDHLGGEQPALTGLVAQGQDPGRLVRHDRNGALHVELPAAGAQGGAGGGLDLLNEPHGGLLPGHRLPADAVGVRLPPGGDQSVEEEPEQARDHRLTALGLNDVHDVVVGVGLELDQDLPDHAHAGPAGHVGQRQGVELLDHLPQEAPVAQAPAPGGAASPVLKELPDNGVPALQELLGGAGDRLVGAHPQQAGVEGVANDDAAQHAHPHGGGELEPGVGLDPLQGDGHYRHLRVPGLAQALAQHGGVVGGPAHAAGLGDGHHAAVGVVGAVGEGANELADHHNRREAGVVVDVAQPHLQVRPGRGLQELDPVAQASHEGYQRPEVDRAHLRHEDGVGGTHLAREDGGGGPRQAAGGLSPGGHDGGGQELGGAGASGGCPEGLGVSASVSLDPGLGSDLSSPGVGPGRPRCPTPPARLGGRRQGAQADGGGPQVGDLVDLQGGVDVTGRLQDLLDLVGGHGVHAAAEGVELDQLQVLRAGDQLGGPVEAGVVGPLVAHPQAGGDVGGPDRGQRAGQALAGDVRPVRGRLRVLAPPGQGTGQGPGAAPEVPDRAGQGAGGHGPLGAVVLARLGLGQDGVLGEDHHAQGVNDVGDPVVDLGVNVVGASGQDDAGAPVLAHPRQGPAPLGAHVGLEGGVLGQARGHGPPGLGQGDVPVGEHLHEALGELGGIGQVEEGGEQAHPRGVLPVGVPARAVTRAGGGPRASGRGSARVPAQGPSRGSA